MDWTSKWVWIGALLVILLIAFGRNPIEEGRQERKRQMKGKDPLVHAIEEHNKEDKNRFTIDRFNRGNYGDAPPGAENVTNQQYRYAPYNPQQPFTQPQAPVEQQQPQAPGYYPPPPEPDGYTPPDPNGPRSKREDLFKLKDGRAYSFNGTKMYTTDASGNQVPLPDGKYPIAGGKLHIIIENGEKTRVTY